MSTTRSRMTGKPGSGRITRRSFFAMLETEVTEVENGVMPSIPVKLSVRCTSRLRP